MLQDDADGMLGGEGDLLLGRVDVRRDDERVDALKETLGLSAKRK